MYLQRANILHIQADTFYQTSLLSLRTRAFLKSFWVKEQYWMSVAHNYQILAEIWMIMSYQSLPGFH